MVEGAGGAARTGRLPEQGQGAEHVQQVCRDLQGSDDGGGQALARHGQPQAQDETDGGDVQVDSIGSRPTPVRHHQRHSIKRLPAETENRLRLHLPATSSHAQQQLAPASRS
uniref:(northern house mosquito) hypothetical protein n=1 Tax=Culex pipiens TaxID=7175 RepID=A0A8D8AZE2_CULPI